MLLNISHNDKKVTRQIESAVGKPYPLWERWRMGGNGSPKLPITSASVQIHNFLVLDNSRNTCNIELRPKGIILRFRARLETYALVIPYYKLTLYKGEAKGYSLYKDDYFVKIQATDRSVDRFFKRLLALKAEHAPTSPVA